MSLIERAIERSKSSPSAVPGPAEERIEPVFEMQSAAIEELIDRQVPTNGAEAPIAPPMAALAPASTAPSPRPANTPVRDAAAGQRQFAEATGPSIELDLDRLKSMGMVTPSAEKTQTFEEFRIIKRPLLMNATGRGAAPVKNGNLIMVTSALPGEGKSFCSVNLAMSMALELDHTVLLVDADVARPSVHKVLGMPLKAGLMDVLLGEKQLPDVLLTTNVEKLRVLPAGRPHPHATELLASDSMGALLYEMSTRYGDRIIVFDSPPLLATSEARVLATRMGQVVVVVESDRTTQRAVQDALRELEQCDVVGLVFNKARRSGGDLYGYYGYGYGAYGSKERQ